jgi:hypothetical protein
MPRTCTDPLFLALLLRMGEKSRRISDGRATWYAKKGKREIPLASGTVQPLFAWRRDPALDWLTSREAIVRDVPVPSEKAAASELAFAASRDIGAIAATSELQRDPERIVYYAVTSFAYAGDEPVDSRAKACRELARRQLSRLSLWLLGEFPRWGSAGARTYAYAVSDHAAMMEVAAEYYATDTPVQAELRDLAAKLDAWSIRAGIPTDEALRVAAELQRESKLWTRRRA